jgi:hypothetical protein
MVLIADLADLLGGMCPRIMPMGLIWLIDFAGTLCSFPRYQNNAATTAVA